MAEHEKRSEQRFLGNWPLQVGRSHRGWTNCKTVDISVSGILFLSAERLRLEEPIIIEIAIRPTVLVRCVAKIVREVSSSGRCFRYADSFRDHSADGRRLLKDTLLAIRRRSVSETPTFEVLSSASSRLANVKRAEPETGTHAKPSRGPVVIRRGR